MNNDTAYQQLVANNHNLIYHCIHKYSLEESEYYDLFAIALCNAARTYKGNGGAGFAQYAIVCMENAMRHEYRYDHYQCRNTDCTVSLSDYDDEDGKDDRTMILTDRCNVVQAVISKDILERGYRRLTEKQRKVFSLILLGYSQAEVADTMGVSHQRIQMQVGEIRSKLAKEAA